MNGLLAGLHPTFESLSAYADLTDVEGARTRVGAHVSRCTACRDEVAGIRALGTAARAMTADGAPSDLRSRIESAAAAAPVAAPSGPPAPAVRSAQARRRVVAGVATALAAAVLGAVLWPRPTALQAAGTSRLTFSPARPVPGGMVRVRYQPTAWMKDAQRLILVGRFAGPAGSNPSRFGSSAFETLGDSLAVLTRGADGAFVATVRLPADFLVVRLSVLDPARDEADLDGSTPWMIIGGTAGSAPSFASFLAAHETRPRWYGGDDRTRPRQAVDAADSLTRHFPRHPAGWAFSRSYGMSKGRFDFLRFFRSAERKYASMYDELWPQRGLDAERLHDMVEFAHSIGEPDEALRWSARLVEEHPEDARALYDLAGALHEVELRMPPALGDTIRQWMPALDRAYRAGPVPNDGFDAALRLATAYGDSTTRARWLGRSSANAVIGNIWMLTRRSPRWARDSVGEALRARAERGCTAGSGRYPLAQPVAEWRRMCELYRGMAYGFLSSHSLRDGRPRAALAEADSAIVAMRRGRFCAPSRAHLEHALASLALGDTATAETDFVLGSAFYPPGATVVDTVRARLGTRVDPARYRVQADSVRRIAAACEREERSRRQAREQRLGQ
jgi:hypothetical protein